VGHEFPAVGLVEAVAAPNTGSEAAAVERDEALLWSFYNSFYNQIYHDFEV
jgi:hypothetical protein